MLDLNDLPTKSNEINCMMIVLVTNEKWPFQFSCCRTLGVHPPLREGCSTGSCSTEAGARCREGGDPACREQGDLAPKEVGDRAGKEGGDQPCRKGGDHGTWEAGDLGSREGGDLACREGTSVSCVTADSHQKMNTVTTGVTKQI